VAVDVGTHQLHERLRDDPRVQVREQTDIRSVKPSQFPNGLTLAVADVSFISLRLVLPVVAELDVDDALVLIKPQFEAGRQEVSRGSGVITSPAIWGRVLAEVLEHASAVGLSCAGLMVSPITGRAGNVEFVGHFVSATSHDDVASLIETVVSEAEEGKESL
jgi:23S rRNA (cytidine1920-2'-O)/16S rRNA (cytidine1409-2'-O)-methyltransferase